MYDYQTPSRPGGDAIIPNFRTYRPLCAASSLTRALAPNFAPFLAFYGAWGSPNPNVLGGSAEGDSNRGGCLGRVKE